jgi:uncharacterized protein YcbK (DUF882 family)
VAGTVALSNADAWRSIASHSAFWRSTRAGYRCGIAALLIFFGCENLQTAVADGETRTISFHHIHTKEDLTVTYKVNGRYDQDALKKINQVLRDWRESEPIQMDPHLIDVLWEVHREVGGKEPIWVVCGYRSPGTNAMLRRRSSGVAQHSQHMLGKAIDFYIPGVALDELRAAGLRAERGGVGYYPSSNFVHLDTGSVRHWPRMPDAQLAALMAKKQFASHNASDDGSVKPTVVAQADRSSLSTFFGKLFGGASEEQQQQQQQAAPAAPAPAQVARAGTPQAKPAKPATYQVASATSKPVTLPARWPMRRSPMRRRRRGRPSWAPRARRRPHPTPPRSPPSAPTTCRPPRRRARRARTSCAWAIVSTIPGCAP